MQRGAVRALPPRGEAVVNKGRHLYTVLPKIGSILAIQSSRKDFFLALLSVWIME